MTTKNNNRLVMGMNPLDCLISFDDGNNKV